MKDAERVISWPILLFLSGFLLGAGLLHFFGASIGEPHGDLQQFADRNHLTVSWAGFNKTELDLYCADQKYAGPGDEVVAVLGRDHERVKDMAMAAFYAQKVRCQ